MGGGKVTLELENAGGRDLLRRRHIGGEEIRSAKTSPATGLSPRAAVEVEIVAE